MSIQKTSHHPTVHSYSHGKWLTWYHLIQHQHPVVSLASFAGKGAPCGRIINLIREAQRFFREANYKEGDISSLLLFFQLLHQSSLSYPPQPGDKYWRKAQLISLFAPIHLTLTPWSIFPLRQIKCVIKNCFIYWSEDNFMFRPMRILCHCYTRHLHCVIKGTKVARGGGKNHRKVKEIKGDKFNKFRCIKCSSKFWCMSRNYPRCWVQWFSPLTTQGRLLPLRDDSTQPLLKNHRQTADSAVARTSAGSACHWLSWPVINLTSLPIVDSRLLRLYRTL